MSCGGLIRLVLVCALWAKSTFSTGLDNAPSVEYALNPSPLQINQWITVNSVDYQITSEIRERKFGKVYGVKNGDSNFALKHINKRSFANPDLLEPRLHSGLHHPNIVKLISWEETQNDVFMILEMCGADLAQTIASNQRPFSENLAKRYIYEIMQGIAYLHSLSIYHGDIKADHVLLEADGTSVKIAEFGSASYAPTINDNYAATHVYAAPEIWISEGPLLASDIWSAGVVLYAMLTYNFPFNLHSKLSPTDGLSLMRKRIDWTRYIGLSPVAVDLLQKMLVVNPSHRLTADQVLSHPWFDELKSE